MGSIVVVMAFPSLEAFGEVLPVVDGFAFEEPIGHFRVDAVRSLRLAVQTRCPGSDLDVADAFVEQVSVECPPEFLAVVGLNLLDLERQLREDVVEELDRDVLVVCAGRRAAPGGRCSHRPVYR